MTGIQALERISPEKPVIPGKCARMEFEYKRNGTQSLIAGRNVASGIVTALCKQTRNENDFLEFIKLIVKENSQYKKIHIILDNLNIHISESLVKYIAEISNIAEDLGKKERRGILKSLKTREKFLTNPKHNIVFHYTPKHASWMNQIEIWFGILNSKVIKRGSFSSCVNLKNKILNFIKYYNDTMARPFKWTYKGQVLEGH
jgi:transposase